MERESLSDALATLCSWLVIPFLIILFIYLFFSHGGLLWAMLPVLFIIFFIKHQAEKNR